MPRKRRSEFPATEQPSPIEAAIADGSLKTADKVETPARGPKGREIEEPRTIYRGQGITLTLDGGETYNLEASQPLNAEQQDRLYRAGFDPVPDTEEKHWQASIRAVRDADADLNVLSVILDRKMERLEQGRGR